MKDRIKKLIETEKMSSSQFAEAIGVQRSNISHILSGRNRPSLDFIEKLLNVFKEIRTEWLMLGKGEMYIKKEEEKKKIKKEIPLKKENNKLEKIDFTKENTNKIEKGNSIKEEKEKKKKKSKKNKKEKSKERKKKKEKSFPFFDKDKNVKKIFIFYSDNTFEEFSPFK